MSTKKILIIGGTGFIGYHLAKKCLNKKWKVTSISTNKPKKIRYDKRINYLICDISKSNLLNVISRENYDYVVNFGGYVDHSNKKKTYLSHYRGVINLSKVLLKRKISQFIQIGSGGEYGKNKSPHQENDKIKSIPKSVYNKSKYLASKYLLNLHKKKNFPVTILRLYQVYGPGQDLNRLIPIVIINCLKNKEFDCSSGEQFRDFLYIDDVIDAIFHCFSSKLSIGNIFNIGSGKPVKIKFLINFLKKNIKKGTPKFGKIKLRNDEMINFFPKILKAQKKINWKSKIKLKAGLKATINYYKKNANYY